MRLFFIIFALSLPLAAHAQSASAPDTTAFYSRLTSDLAAGNPLVATVYVALCDNDSQGIIPVNNRSICNGDDPDKNMYWKGNGIHGYLTGHGWKRVYHATQPDGVILVESVYKKRFFAAKSLRQQGVPKQYTAYVVAKAYRGSRIHDAMKDYISAVHTDTGQSIELKTGITIHAGGKSHVVGYIGHDYFMDVFEGQSKYNDLISPIRSGNSTLAKGAFAFACVSNEFVRPAVSRPNVYIFAMNNFLTYPSAWTLGGIMEGIAKGGDGATIYKSAASSFAKGQKCGLRWAKKAFSFGP
ncbi:MAG: hypothetical protein JXX29_04085 [Deltaproteobacteria bacterium]|nr:hypothetical protein [Deltaproteobacteria bacterium]MBN2670823.1 hypothetical protein [Deltaproteobacteria bacterium]